MGRNRLEVHSAGVPESSDPLSDFRDDRHFTIFDFKTAGPAQAFHTRFGSELLPVVEDKPGRRRRRR
jgi:hypothetical protein